MHNLTKIDLLCYLLAKHDDEEKMKGTIRAKGRCPKCDKDFIHIRRIGYACPDCKTTPSRFFVDLFYKGQRIRIFSDKQGQVLDSYQRAINLLSHINYELKHHSFDPSKYVKAELRKFFVMNLLDDFLNDRINEIAPSYQKDYRLMVSRANEFFNTTDIGDIRKKNIKDYARHLKQKYSIGDKTVKNHIDHFHAFMAWCVEEAGVIDILPPFPHISYNEYQFNWVSQDDQISLFGLVPDIHKPIVAFLMLHGCRPSEGRALKCNDVTLSHKSITIAATFSGRVYREKRKGRKSKPVSIPIHPEVYDFIAERVKNNLPEAYVFVNPKTGRHYSENSLRRIWDGVRKKAGIGKELRLYDVTRHSLASQLVNSGTTLFKVSKLLGHSSVKMTEKYSHSNIESLRTEIIKLSLKPKTTVTRLSLGAKRDQK